MENINIPSVTSLSDWIEHPTYWENTSPQGSPRWHSLRQGRLTMSRLSVAVGHSPYPSETPEKLGQELRGEIIVEFGPEALRRMAIGTKNEPQVRQWYSRDKGITIREVGIIIPKDNIYLGASLDGDIVGSNGMIEIKCPEYSYTGLNHYNRLRRAGVDPKRADPYYHGHIKIDHYDQMQGCMALAEKEWCDYIVYAQKEGIVTVERVPFNREYWLNILYPNIQRFIDEHLRKRDIIPVCDWDLCR